MLEQLDSPAATSDWLQKVKQGAAIEISTEAFSEIDTRSDTLLKNSSSWTVFLDTFNAISSSEVPANITSAVKSVTVSIGGMPMSPQPPSEETTTECVLRRKRGALFTGAISSTIEILVESIPSWTSAPVSETVMRRTNVPNLCAAWVSIRSAVLGQNSGGEITKSSTEPPSTSRRSLTILLSPEIRSTLNRRAWSHSSHIPGVMSTRTSFTTVVTILSVSGIVRTGRL